jgi:hypothetical protein
MLSVARKFQIPKLIIAGDGLDMTSFSNFGSDPALSWDEEMEWAAEWLWILYHAFDKIVWFRGNHCDRLARATNWQLKATRLIPALLCTYADMHKLSFNYDPDKLTLSNYPFCYLDDEWMIVHPKSYSRIPMRVGSQLALIHDRHIMGAHSHRSGITWADDGKHLVVELGCMADFEKIQYRHMSVTTHGEWQNAFVLYGNGHPVLFGDEPLTNWSLFE